MPQLSACLPSLVTDIYTEPVAPSTPASSVLSRFTGTVDERERQALFVSLYLVHQHCAVGRSTFWNAFRRLSQSSDSAHRSAITHKYSRLAVSLVKSMDEGNAVKFVRELVAAHPLQRSLLESSGATGRLRGRSLAVLRKAYLNVNDIEWLRTMLLLDSKEDVEKFLMENHILREGQTVVFKSPSTIAHSVKIG